MATVWFILVTFMITAYVVLDGFDLGAGAWHLWAARTDEERRLILRSIGPVWDGNEVWLIAGGGTIYFAFPLLYASAFSGFYLPLTIVLWLLIMRAISIEFRAHLETPVWRSFFDGLFMISSVLLAIFFGAALGNVMRGVPMGRDHLFFEALWTDWKVSPNPGILDWYTLLTGVVALVALAIHGALYLWLKNSGELAERVRRSSLLLSPLLVVLTAASLVATAAVRPQLMQNYFKYPIWFAIPVFVASSLSLMLWAIVRARERLAFLASSVYLSAMLAGAAVGLYPTVLPASNGVDSLTIESAATSAYLLKIGLYWWLPGIALAITYFVFVYTTFEGKVGAGKSHG
ncbi:MAG: cytochrome d ubiquinol oxidase subunit II [Acidobacteria bacterium]|nr:cytochrome d ubiquinol oxidase subunit II [Acidobacteriota bacterium]